MPVALQCDSASLPLSVEEGNALWRAVITHQQHADQEVVVRCVTEAEVTDLNQKYRKKEGPTNVLTFSYGQEHDIALCMAVAKREADGRGVSLRDYVALLLVHAYLHATGLDHEQSAAAESEMKSAEKSVLRELGYSTNSLSD